MATNRKKTRYTKSSAFIYILDKLYCNGMIKIDEVLKTLQISSATLYKYIQDLNFTFLDFGLNQEICKGSISFFLVRRK